MAVILLPSLLATEAGGQKRFELDAKTVGDALRALPVAPLLFDEGGELRRLINVYVDGADVRAADGLDTLLAPSASVRIVAAVAGGQASDGRKRALPPVAEAQRS